MTLLLSRRRSVLSALLLALACTESDSQKPSDAGASGAPDTTATAAAPRLVSLPIRGEAPVWYHRIRLLDVTGDGRKDTLDLQARGHSSDSSTVTFRVIVDGKVAFTDSWSSDYELVDPPPEAATEAGRDSLIRTSLDTTLVRISVLPIDTTEWAGPLTAVGDDCMEHPRDCLASEFRQRRAQIDWTKIHADSIAAVYQRVSKSAFDTAAVLRIAGDMRRPGAVQFTLSYGYETTHRLAWSPSEQEVFVIFSCC